jgi:hypothetical protein
MKSFGISVFVVLVVLLGSAVQSVSQPLNPGEEAQQLRAELSKLLDRETEIEMRIHELDYELKPENIESHFAGVGSTRPEELRAMRRKKLQAEKDRLVKQLSEISQDRSRMEAAILNAETRANFAAAVTNSATVQENRMSPLSALLVGRSRQVAAIALGLILIGLIVAFVRKRNLPETR